jgi:hypothetical protein
VGNLYIFLSHPFAWYGQTCVNREWTTNREQVVCWSDTHVPVVVHPGLEEDDVPLLELQLSRILRLKVKQGLQHHNSIKINLIFGQHLNGR